VLAFDAALVAAKSGIAAAKPRAMKERIRYMVSAPYLSLPDLKILARMDAQPYRRPDVRQLSKPYPPSQKVHQTGSYEVLVKENYD
jgi:hypothetical protein